MLVNARFGSGSSLLSIAIKTYVQDIDGVRGGAAHSEVVRHNL